MLLVLLVATYLVSAFVQVRWIVALQVAFFAAVLVIGARRSATVSWRYARLLLLALLAGSAAMFVVSLLSEAGKGVADAWVALILLSLAVMMVRRVFTTSTVTVQSIFGALSAYLVLGLMFSSIYAAIDHLGGNHFFANGQPANSGTLQYFSFETLTTLGNGDFTAAGPTGRAIVILEVLTGQIFLATLLARLVTAFHRPSEQRR